MENKNNLNARYETVAWGALFILWGLTGLFDFLPDGLGALGIGLILLGLNLARSIKGLPVSTFTTALGLAALLLGGLDLARTALGLHIDLPVFALTLLILGGVILARTFLRRGEENIQ